MTRRYLLQFLKTLARYRALLFHIELLENAAERLRGDLRTQMRTYVQRQMVIKDLTKTEIISLARSLRIPERDLPL